MQIQESGEMYLETILILSQSSSHVRAIDVGEYMGFSKPSVSRGLHILEDNGYLKIGSDGAITLTETGNEVATKIYERHKILTSVLMQLGVSEKTAIMDACKMEHDISDETVNAIKKHIDSLKEKGY